MRKNLIKHRKKCLKENLNQNQVKHLAETLSTILKIGDTVFLSGVVGSGKTFFARHLIQNFLKINGVEIEEVPSPSYTLVQVYDSAFPAIWHVDLYRLSDSNEVVELGLEDMFPSIIALVEWPERMNEKVPNRYLCINFCQGSSSMDERSLLFEFYGNNWDHLLKTDW